MELLRCATGATLGYTGAMDQTRQLTSMRLLAYGGPAVPLSMLMMPLVTYVPPFYGSELGLSLTSIGMVFFLARAWDALIDPLFGMLSDRTPGRFGRRKPWMLIGAPGLIVATWALCQPPEGGVTIRYLATWTVLFYLFWTIVQVPYASWGAELSRNYTERARIAGFREGGQMIGTLLATGLPILVFMGVEPSLREILAVFTLSVAILLPITVAGSVSLVPHVDREAPKSGWRKGIGLLLRNRPFGLLAIAAFFIWLGGFIYNATVLFLVEFAFELTRSDFLKFVFVQYVVALACVRPIVKLCGQFGKHRILAAGAVGFASVLACLMLAPPGNPWLVGALFALKGSTLGVILVVPMAIAADTVDYGRFRGGADEAGLYMAVFQFIQKMAVAMGVGVALPMLEFLGFSPTEPNAQSALVALKGVALALPALCAFVAAGVLMFYPLDARRHATVVRWNGRRSKESIRQ